MIEICKQYKKTESIQENKMRSQPRSEQCFILFDCKLTNVPYAGNSTSLEKGDRKDRVI